VPKFNVRLFSDEQIEVTRRLQKDP